MLKWGYGALAILLYSSILHGDVRVYLFPEAEAGKDGLRMEDVAKFEGPVNEVEMIRGAVIEKRIYSDGFLDRSRLHELLREMTGETIHIYGNAVKIILPVSLDGREKKQEDSLVKSGDPVVLAIIKRGIRIEVDGVAVNGGSEGDMITVKVKNRKSLQGVIVNRRLVEARL